ncbi:helix-turn-helix transcriptional regulator [Nitratifractor sp.]
MKPTQTINDDPRNDFLLSDEDFRKTLGGISRSTLWRRIKEGTIPEPIKIGRRSFYRRSWADRIIVGELPAAQSPTGNEEGPKIGR